MNGHPKLTRRFESDSRRRLWWTGFYRLAVPVIEMSSFESHLRAHGGSRVTVD